MGYADKQIAAAQKRIGDAVAGKGLRDAIRKLQDKARIRNSLEDPPARGSIVAKRKLAKPAGTSQTDFTEKSRNYHQTLREVRSSDGLFVVQYYNLYQWITTAGTVFEYADYQP